MKLRFLIFVLRGLCKTESLSVIYKDREFKIGKEEISLILEIKNIKFINKIFYAPSLALAEGYMDKDFLIKKGTFFSFSNMLFLNYNKLLNSVTKFPFFKLYLIFNPLLQLNFLFKSKKNVSHHYDLSDKLYDLFLDKNRQYSCAYFEKQDNTLEQAQVNKMTRLASKLHLNNSDKVLDIGCGWGGLGRFFVENYDCSLKGISLSTEQINYCEKMKTTFSKSSKLEYALQDYRKEKGKFSKIISVGMFEHVGKPFFKTFFSKINDLLAEDGIAVVHTIGNLSNPKITPAFIRKYIFPGGYIPSLSEIMPAVENSGLIISDIEILRLHYAKTLRHWFNNFSNNIDKIKELYDDRFLKMWEVYLNLSELSFIHGDNVVFQLVLTKKKDSFPIVR